MKETILSAKLSEKGILPRDVKLQLAIAEFQNNGGMYGTALALLDAAYKMGSEGLVSHADKADRDLPSLSQPNDDEAGRDRVADKAKDMLPTSSSPKATVGQKWNAVKAVSNFPSVAPYSPGHAKRGILAIAQVQATVSKSLFDTTILPDGRSLREVRWSECPNLSARYRKASRVLMAIYSTAVPADHNATLDNVVNEDKLNEIISAVEKFNDLY